MSTMPPPLPLVAGFVLPLPLKQSPLGNPMGSIGVKPFQKEATPTAKLGSPPRFRGVKGVTPRAKGGIPTLNRRYPASAESASHPLMSKSEILKLLTK